MNIPLSSTYNNQFYTPNRVASKRLFDKRKCKCVGNFKCQLSQGCNTISLLDTVELLSRINYKITTLSDTIYNNLVHKFPLSNEQSSLDKLIIYRESLTRYKLRLIRNAHLCKVCNVDHKIQVISEKAKNLLGVGYSPERSIYYSLVKNVPELEDGLIYDDSKLASWLTSNPYCAPVDLWEKLAYRVCGALNIEIDVEEIKCNLTFEIVKESIPLDVLCGLSLGKCTKKNGILNKRTPDQCKLDWEILVERIDCDLDYDVYIDLVKDCNLTFDVISEAYKCGLSFSTSNGQYYLKGKNFTYNLSEIDFTSPVTSYSKLLTEGIKFTNNSVDRLKLEKLLADYHITEKDLRKLK